MYRKCLLRSEEHRGQHRLVIKNELVVSDYQSKVQMMRSEVMDGEDWREWIQVKRCGQ